MISFYFIPGLRDVFWYRMLSGFCQIFIFGLMDKIEDKIAVLN